ncbi:hypothetical protein [Burkholderia sp. ABCPW 111]|uniref:hypothetical protein n=1 Tax=Burkholderia sp. ABCPW 111 TaxID=1820025 RepID=UPI00126A257D|nr:hypothetical protein [Burkholderia sp. ABCPW 111]
MAAGKVTVEHPLTPDELKGFESRVNFFLWLLPFVTASLGTNILSDALLRDFTYRDQWILKRFFGSLLSGERVFGSGKVTQLSLESRRTISEMARHDLQSLLAELPQFAGVGKMGRLINMMDGSTVAPYLPRGSEDVFTCKLTVLWNAGTTPVDVDAERYMEVQFQLAATLGSNTASLRRKASELYEEIRGW